MSHSYTEEEIRKAWKVLELSGFGSTYINTLIQALKAEDAHLHDFADADTITVKEIRETFQRLLPEDSCRMCGAKFHGGDKPSEYFLKDVSEHREPEYPVKTYWKDAKGKIWYTSGETWQKMQGAEGESHDIPLRPLKKMITEP